MLDSYGLWWLPAILGFPWLVVAVVQPLRCFQLFVTPWTAARQDSLSFTISQSLHKLISIESVMRSNHLILCHPFPSSIFPSIRVFSSESALHIRWPKYWNFGSSISLFSEYSGLISFRMDWFDHWFAVAQLHPRLHLHLALSVESPLCLQISPYTDIKCRAHPNPV